MKTYTTQEWFDFGNSIYELLISEMNDSSYISEPVALYERLVYGYEFFRMIRGEAFHSQRPHGLGDLQNKLYAMEDDLYNKLMEVKSRINSQDSSVKYKLDLAKKPFEL